MTTPQHFSISDFVLEARSNGGNWYVVEGFADENEIFTPPDAVGQANMRVSPDGIQYSTDRPVEIGTLTFTLESNSPFFTQHSAALTQAGVRGVPPPFFDFRAEHIMTGQVTAYSDCLVDRYRSFPAITRGETPTGDIPLSFQVNPLNIRDEGVRNSPPRRTPVENNF